jgi:hypothetical protein
MLESFRSLRKFSGGRGYPKRGFARAKTPRTPSSEVQFLCGLCAFAGDIPSFGCGFAALGSLRLGPAHEIAVDEKSLTMG